MSTMGDVLRQAREQQGIDIQQVSDAIHINPSYLEALETERLDEFPAEVYARGFLRSYASFLGLDPVPLLEEFQALCHPAGSEPPPGRRRQHRPEAVTATTEVYRRPSAQATSLFPYAHGGMDRERGRGAGGILVALALLVVGAAAFSFGGRFIHRIESFLRSRSGSANHASHMEPSTAIHTKKSPPAPRPSTTVAHDAPLVLSLRFNGYAYVTIHTDIGKNGGADGLYMPGKHQTIKGKRLITLYADRGNVLSVNLNGKDIGRLAPRPRKVWCWFEARPNDLADWGYGKPPQSFEGHPASGEQAVSGSSSAGKAQSFPAGSTSAGTRARASLLPSPSPSQT